MKKTEQTEERFLIWKNLRDNHRIDLSEEQLDLIDDVFAKSIINNVFNIGVYRFINSIIGMAFSIVSFVIAIKNEVCINQWFFFFAWTAFSIYNILHCFKGVVKHSILKSKHENNIWTRKK